ncbi:unnamed protein product, partial [marine sediment metagenome]
MLSGLVMFGAFLWCLSWQPEGPKRRVGVANSLQL